MPLLLSANDLAGIQRYCMEQGVPPPSVRGGPIHSHYILTDSECVLRQSHDLVACPVEFGAICGCSCYQKGQQAAASLY